MGLPKGDNQEVAEERGNVIFTTGVLQVSCSSSFQRFVNSALKRWSRVVSFFMGYVS